jgi:hypothetical protein
VETEPDQIEARSSGFRPEMAVPVILPLAADRVIEIWAGQRRVVRQQLGVKAAAVPVRI